MEPDEQLAAIVPALVDLVDGIDGRNLYDPTPCRQFCVHDVLDHMILGATTFAHAFRGEAAPDMAAPVEYGWVPKAEFRTALCGLLDAVRSPGAMDRTIETAFGPMPATAFARFVAFDGLIHGWDIARSTGQPYEPPEDVVVAVDGFARRTITDDMRDGDRFAGQTVPPQGATTLERLVAFSGRDVHVI